MSYPNMCDEMKTTTVAIIFQEHFSLLEITFSACFAVAWNEKSLQPKVYMKHTRLASTISDGKSFNFFFLPSK